MANHEINKEILMSVLKEYKVKDEDINSIADKLCYRDNAVIFSIVGENIKECDAVTDMDGELTDKQFDEIFEMAICYTADMVGYDILDQIEAAAAECLGTDYDNDDNDDWED